MRNKILVPLLPSISTTVKWIKSLISAMKKILLKQFGKRYNIISQLTYLQLSTTINYSFLQWELCPAFFVINTPSEQVTWGSITALWVQGRFGNSPYIRFTDKVCWIVSQDYQALDSHLEKLMFWWRNLA